jgi:hypothetical protein
MDNLQDALLLKGVQAWCDECADERILLPVGDDAGGGYCCTVCDAALFLAWPEEMMPAAPHRQSA